MTTNLEERVARLEAVIENVNRELTEIHAQLRTDRTINIGLWITTMVAIVIAGLFK